jgi:hypothetical protein
MTNIIDYLQKNYYERYAKLVVMAEHLPNNEMLLEALERHTDKLVVITESGSEVIIGCAVFLKLNDATYEAIESFDLRRVDVLSRLLEQNGENFHIILLAASGGYVIRAGLRELKKLKPKSISWWNPTMTNIHRMNLRS